MTPHDSERRVVLFGNSGAGKSTYAQRLQASEGLAHLDLDTLAWEDESPPRRRSLSKSRDDIDAFIAANPAWVIEGCYADLLEFAISRATDMVWLNPATETCIAHAKSRPWEPHKYPSKAAQDANLPMLIDWIRAYDSRTDEFSRTAHAKLFQSFPGKKRELRESLNYTE